MDEHDDRVGAAPSWTLKRGPGGASAPDVPEAWTEACTPPADTMKAAAKGAELAG